MSSHIFSAYRAYVRQIVRLPDVYLRQFYRLKVADDARAILATREDPLRISKFKRFTKDLRRMEAANGGSVRHFRRMLDIAYGRRGKLRREIMEPILSDPREPVPPRIIPNVESSSPPVYSRELKVLLTSGISRSTGALKAHNLVSPPSLPRQADPGSLEAKYFGSFSKRREVNIRWKYFVSEWKKVLPPLELSAFEENQLQHENALQASGRPIGLQGSHVLENLEQLAGPASPSRPLTRREKKLDQSSAVDPPIPIRHPSRWVRRRHQQLLNRIPILQYRDSKSSPDKFGVYSVVNSPAAFPPSSGGQSPIWRLVRPSAADSAWLKKADTRTKTSGRR